MKIICWNWREIGNSRIVQDLSLMVKEKRPILVFVCETKARSCKIAGLQRRLGVEECLVVDYVGKRGGLVLLWRDEKGVEVVNYSNWHISMIVKRERDGRDWNFIGFYGHLEIGKIGLSWDLLRRLMPFNYVAWCVGGYFNEILRHNEKVGGKKRAKSEVNMFIEVLEDCGLGDIGC